MYERLSTTAADHLSSAAIKRKAINSTGHLGSLYDGYRDDVIRLGNKNVQGQRLKSSKLAQCQFIRGDMDVNRNVLRMIGIEDDLRLSLLLNLTRRIGIASIINYPYRMNEHTRLLYYSWVDREEQVSDEIIRDLNLNELIKRTPSATHVITGIKYGINMIAVLQLPSEIGIINEIDRILQKISNHLSNDTDNVLSLTSEENDFLTKTNKIIVYSNVRDLTSVNKATQLLHQIDKIKKHPNQCAPINYILRPFASLYPRHTGKEITFQILPAELNNNVEQYVLRKQIFINNLKLILHNDVLKMLSEYLDAIVYGARNQYSLIEQKYSTEIKRLSELVISFRKGYIGISDINDALIDKESQISKDERNELLQNLNNLEAKAYLISTLMHQNFSYCNTVERDVSERDNENTIRAKLFINDRSARAVCSNDTLNKDNQQLLRKLLFDLKEERQNNRHLYLIYADFTYCSFRLPRMIVLSSDNRKSNGDLSTRQLRPPPVSSQYSVQQLVEPESWPPPNDEIINILLLGETGVGKSTFINAFANYLTFDSLGQAQPNKPIVIIPVSFLITVGNHFEERTVKFGDVNNSLDEDFNHPGQSVTQCCKSYLFRVNSLNGKKLRIIDTPGFGDTRGLDQDDRNMQHILEYINNLTHLNAICCLLKPNTSRLSVFLRSCFTQLFSLIGPTARENIMFFFTNARSTFYTPGDTAPLLKTMLNSLSITDIPFEKKNTFCFDSESFRFLVAVQNGISFSDEDKHEYVQSWSISVKESNRLIEYIGKNVRPYRIRNGWQSIKNAQFEISHMIRPILEAMRNTLRNLILCKTNSSKVSIELRPKASSRPIAICSSCKRRPIQVDHFWITPDNPHNFHHRCNTCTCAATRHDPIDYLLEYRTINNPSIYQQNQLEDMLHRLCGVSAELSHFLIHGARSTKDDLFILGLLRMIREEDDICAEKKSNQMNLQLMEDLGKMRHEYTQRMREVAARQDRKTLTAVYTNINNINTYPEIREQLITGKQQREAIMKQNEVVL